MKKLQRIKDSKDVTYSHLAGVAWKDSNRLGINIELLWKHSKKDTKFIPLFSEYYTHEFLHLYLRDIGTEMGEETIIRKLLNQPFSKAEKRYYKQFFK